MVPMRAGRAAPACLWLLAFAGCSFVRSSELTSLREQNRALSEQQRTATTELGNTQAHARQVEQQLARTEEELALLDERVQLAQRQLDNYQRERAILQAACQDATTAPTRVPAEVTRRLAALTQRMPQLKHDPQAGAAKLDADILFDRGSAELKPEAEQALASLVGVLRSAEGTDFRVLVVGHTDAPPTDAPPKVGPDSPAGQFYISAERALAVSDALRRLGLPDSRIAIGGLGAHQPVAVNAGASASQKNRRVEVFVVAPDVPIVGWTETTPTLYR